MKPIIRKTRNGGKQATVTALLYLRGEGGGLKSTPRSEGRCW